MQHNLLPQNPPQLRLYQAAIVNNTYAKIRQGYRRILCFTPTGAGKTVISSQIVDHAAQRTKWILFLVITRSSLKPTTNSKDSG
jgi:superfamily II DNA or RNA helicase